MVEQEQAHRIEHERKRLAAAIFDGRMGHVFGFLLSVACVAGAIYSVYLRAHPTVSIALVSLPMVAAIKALIRRR